MVRRPMTRGSADQAAIAVATAAVIGLLDAALVITGTAGAKGLSISLAAVDAPNVIVIFVDTVRYDAVFDPEGRVHRDLPTLAALRDQSTAFTRAYATSSWTLPSRVTWQTS
jgi:hypothetical protein